MDNSRIYFRVAYVVVLVGLTVCYIFGNVIQDWWSWFIGLAYGVSFNELVMSFKRQPKKVVSNKVFWQRLLDIVILVMLTACCIFGDAIQVWRNTFSGLAYGLAISGFLWTFEGWKRLTFGR